MRKKGREREEEERTEEASETEEKRERWKDSGVEWGARMLT